MHGTWWVRFLRGWRSGARVRAAGAAIAVAMVAGFRWGSEVSKPNVILADLPAAAVAGGSDAVGAAGPGDQTLGALLPGHLPVVSAAEATEAPEGEEAPCGGGAADSLHPASQPGAETELSGPGARAHRAEGSIDINRATLEELDALPGIGPVLARRVVEFRERFGPFRQVEDLLEVPGIGPATLQRLRDRVRV